MSRERREREEGSKQKPCNFGEYVPSYFLHVGYLGGALLQLLGTELQTLAVAVPKDTAIILACMF